MFKHYQNNNVASDSGKPCRGSQALMVMPYTTVRSSTTRKSCSFLTKECTMGSTVTCTPGGLDTKKHLSHGGDVLC